MCEICERIKLIKDGKNPYLVKELETGYVVIGDNQHFKGYTLFLYKEHVKEVYDLKDNIRIKHLDEMSMIAKAVEKAFKCEKMNIESLGNGDSHLHWHFFPRVTGDLEPYGNKGPVWWYPKEKMYDDSNKLSDEELETMKIKLLEELSKVFK